MAISIDPATLVITVPQADCTLVSGSFYRLPTKTVFKAQVDSLMDDEDRMFLKHPIDHNTEYTVAGVTYAPKIEIVNGASVVFTPDTLWSVELTESNNNLWDVGNGILVQNSVQVIPTNSAGLQVVSSGSGLSAAQDAKLTSIDIRTAYHNQIINNLKELKKIAGSWYLIIYGDGETSGGAEILRKKVTDSAGADISDLTAGVLAAELESTA